MPGESLTPSRYRSRSNFEGAYSIDPAEGGENVRRLAQTGAVGCNFEDQVIGGEGLHPLDLQARRIAAIRAAVGPRFFINARTDLLLKRRPMTTLWSTR